MKNVLFLLSICFFLSCDDGNLDISSFEFEDEINTCGDDVITLYLYSTNGHKEVLILTLTDQEIRQDEEAVPPIQVTEGGPYTVTDRVFETEVTDAYFCALLPPTEPKVLRNWIGESGNVLVENKPVYDTDSTTIIAWEHVIVLNDVVLKDGGESLIFNDTYLFGTYQTTVE